MAREFTLAEKFPRLYNLTMSKNITVAVVLKEGWEKSFDLVEL